MNGVRRFLGGTVSTSPEPVLPLGTTRSNWPPSGAAPDDSPPPDGPSNHVSALTLRKNNPATAGDDSEPQDGRWRPMNFFSKQPNASGSPNSSPAARAVPLPGSPTTASRTILSSSPPTNGRASPGLANSSTRPNTASTSELGRKALQSNPTFKRTSAMFNSKDELLISLLASEAVVDSRDFEILSAEEVDELKKEQQLLSSRLAAMRKKLALETRIRDAAQSLARMTASGKPSDKLENANRKVDAAQRELWGISERYNDVLRRLNEHRAGVLSYSVRNLESQLAPPPPKLDANANDDSSTSGNSTFDATGSPASSATSVSVVSKGRFDGAHLFSGHEKSIQPRRPATLAEVSELEDKLRQATEKLKAASQKQAAMTRELSYLRLEKEEAQTMMDMELQGATETISDLELQVAKMSDLDAAVGRVQEERQEWAETRRQLEEKARLVDRLERRLEDMEARNGETVGMEGALAQAQEEVATVKQQLEIERRNWERERIALEEGKAREVGRSEEFARLQDELRLVNIQMNAGQDALRNLIRAHNIECESDALPAMMSTVANHLVLVRSKAQEELDTVRRRLQDDIHKGMDRREQLANELEQARREREEARADVRMLETRLRDQDSLSADRLSRYSDSSSGGDMSKVTLLLQPIWAILPAPESRTGKFPPRSPLSPRPGFSSSPTLTPVSPGLATSISDLDVRALKALYDTTSNGGPLSYVNREPFNLESFAARVSALVSDDRALIERLLRFAQAHDLLKKNAERAQKLAQESNQALETYQRQVSTLESRSQSALTRQAELLDAVANLEDTVEKLMVEKQAIEKAAAENEDAVRQLTEVNNALSAQTLTLADEAANAPLAVKRQMEEQLADCRTKLQQAQDEVEAMRMSEQTQRVALLDELNSMQTENSQLRDQLRAAKR